MKILEDKSIGECFVCKTQFTLKEVKYSEVTDYYVKKFFPQIPKHFLKFSNQEHLLIHHIIKHPDF